MDISQAIEKLSQLNEKEALKKELSIYINNLLLNDFTQLIQLLYRVDISENKLKQLLQENKEANAGDLIADLLIKRQEEKMAMRQSFPPANDVTDDERW